MATIQETSPAPWRMRLRPASFAGVVFHVENQGRAGGRRVVLHEYPKRDTPYAEDMGRSTCRYQITGYIVGPSYHLGKEKLMTALDSLSVGELVDPYLAQAKQCVCERYSVSETRDRGGYCTFEMAFVEVGNPGNTPQQTDSKSGVQDQAKTTADNSAATLDGAKPLGQGGIGHA